MNLNESYKNRIKELAGIKENDSLSDLKLLSKSVRGDVYLNDKGNIVKITNDKSEFDNAVEFMNNPHKGFVNYYQARPFKDIDGVPHYYLEMDKLTELDDDEWDAVDLINQSLGRQDYMLNDNKVNTFLRELKMNPEWYEDYGDYQKMYNLVKDIHSMYREAENRGIVLYDLKSQNLGRDAGGNLVHFDIGAG